MIHGALKGGVISVHRMTPGPFEDSGEWSQLGISVSRYCNVYNKVVSPPCRRPSENLPSASPTSTTIHSSVSHGKTTPPKWEFKYGMDFRPSQITDLNVQYGNKISKTFRVQVNTHFFLLVAHSGKITDAIMCRIVLNCHT